METIIKLVLGAMWDHARDRLRAHTVDRVRKVVLVATYPRVTPKGDSIRLWRSCARVAWKGLTSPHADALDYFVAMRERVEESARFTRGVVNSNLTPRAVSEMRDEHLDAVVPLPRRPVAMCDECNGSGDGDGDKRCHVCEGSGLSVAS